VLLDVDQLTVVNHHASASAVLSLFWYFLALAIVAIYAASMVSLLPR
jgi:hypothetical protein